uniref:AlNc14C80G5260 protein n=1 Tax=Albugo laibachii Nc14 TaxID=890382 RepID=F0WF66_9STRA|nr:AlNc14C80G5260 [Albugo laibachii Nc14]|eukprot:CCA19848.1 AlNc14C80G5260 [Albugo laibachii Nc14]
MDGLCDMQVHGFTRILSQSYRASLRVHLSQHSNNVKNRYYYIQYGQVTYA